MPGACATGWIETRLTTTSFNLRVGPDSVGMFLGGNQGLASTGDAFVSLFTQAIDNQDPATVYFVATP